MLQRQGFRVSGHFDADAEAVTAATLMRCFDDNNHDDDEDDGDDENEDDIETGVHGRGGL